jgi:hypothetical protein
MKKWTAQIAPHIMKALKPFKFLNNNITNIVFVMILLLMFLAYVTITGLNKGFDDKIPKGKQIKKVIIMESMLGDRTTDKKSNKFNLEKDFCKINLRKSDKLNEKCSVLAKNTCEKMSCCKYIESDSGSKCVGYNKNALAGGGTGDVGG